MIVSRHVALVALAWALAGVPAAAKPCLAVVIHDDDRLTFRNVCGVCKRAVWSWGAGQSWFSRQGTVESIWQGTYRWTRKYEVPAHGEISIEEEWPTGKLVREEVCKKTGAR
jgi:hypothetical protein